MWLHSAWLWNTMAVGRRSGGRSVTSTPSMAICPALGASKPPMMRKSVDLPEPDGPNRQTSSPSSMTRSMASSAMTLPNALAMPLN